MALAMRWRSTKRRKVVSHVKPGETVRVESLDPELMDRVVQIFHVPEPFLRRMLYKLTRRVGIPQVPLKFVDDGPGGPLSEPWVAAQLPPPQKPTRYVAALDGGGASGPLIVTDRLTFDTVATIGGGAAIDGGVVSAVTQVPLPLQLDIHGTRRTRTKGTAYGLVDPRVELKWMTTGGGDRPLNEYLESYLLNYDEIAGLRSGELLGLVREEYADCFEAPAVIGAEYIPSAFDLAEGDAVDVSLDFYPQEPGRALAAVGAVDTESGALLTVSDLMVLTYTDDGLLLLEDA
jgi:hypothetical protein